MIDTAKVKEDADAEETAGRFHKAIALLRQIVADNPRDYGTTKRIVDLQARIASAREAAVPSGGGDDFVLIGTEDWLLKAIVVWRQLQKLDPTALEPHEELAALYARQGLMVEAKQHYQFLVEEYKKQGRTRDLCDVLRKMTEIDPDDLEIQSMLAECYLVDGNTEKSVEVHITIAQRLIEKNGMSEALEVLERGLKIDPKSGRVRAELARVYLIQKNGDKAVQALDGMLTAEEHAHLLAAIEAANKGTPGDPEGRKAAFLEIERVLLALGQRAAGGTPHQEPQC